MFNNELLKKMNLSLFEIEIANELVNRFGCIEFVVKFCTKLGLYDVCLSLENLNNVLNETQYTEGV